MTNPVLEQYTTGKPIVEGTFGHLTPEQTKLLQALWTRLLASFDRSADELTSAPLPAQASGDGAAAKDAGRSSSAPASGRTSRQQRRLAAAPSPTPSGSSGWFNWGGSSAKLAESVEYRQLVEDAAAEESQPPEFVVDQQQQQQKQSVRTAFWNAVLCDHPDVLLLRFLRARKWHVDDALDMLLKCLRWRIDEELDRVVWEGEGPLNLGLMRRGIGATHKTDRIGQPVLHIPVKLNDPKAQPTEQMIDYTVYLMELARVVLYPPTEKVCLVFDTTDMSLSNMDWTFFRTYLHYLEHYYPECLGLVLIYNASWVFNGLWKLIRPLLDPVVASKVHFVGSRDEIQNFIAPENLPKHLGGTDDFVYEYPMPRPGENAAMRDVAARMAATDRRLKASQRLEDLTREWAAAGASSNEAAQQREQAASELVAASRALDRYVRARTLYHRLGVINDDLTVNWQKS